MPTPLPPTEIKNRLKSAQSLFQQGDLAAAQPIFEKVLANVGEDSLEATLCLSNLVDIYESKGNLKSAIDCGSRLLRQPLVPTVAAVKASQLSEMMRQVG